MKPYSHDPSHESNQVAALAARDHEPSLPNGVARLASDIKDVGVQSGQAIQRLVHDTGDLAAHGAHSVRNGAHELRERSIRLRDATASYVQQEPMKSIFMAAAAGAALMGLVALLSRTIGR